MIKVIATFLVLGMMMAGPSLGKASAAEGESQTISIGKQKGLSYLPLIIAEKQSLIEKQAKNLGLADLKVQWVSLASAVALTDAVLSGQVNYVAGASPVLNILWDKTNKDVKGVVNLGNFDYQLNAARPSIKSVKDFTESDRIAVSGVKLSVHAILLQIAASDAFGEDKWDSLDKLTVSMPHPTAYTALTSGSTEITAHLTTPPFQDMELDDPRIHKVWSASDILGGGGVATILFAKSETYAQYPIADKAIVAAVVEAMEFIKANPDKAAAISNEIEKSPLPDDRLAKIIASPANEYSIAPRNVLKFAQFQNKVGTLKNRPESWRDLFFSDYPDSPDGN
ncbi:MAG: ABC transporter substrate-binding protein [Candidatus Adiutrix sp.]|jgi:NitT/TauT family transport system substrate-binding protein|nr:ABC transporter substrate-binding protein [Candidatus Adiutrix sp.]